MCFLSPLKPREVAAGIWDIALGGLLTKLHTDFSVLTWLTSDSNH